MYFIILNVCACTLLLSSVLTIITLLKKQFKQWMDTPLYILSVSDALFSLFTSSILFINSMIHIIYVEHNEINIFPMSDNIWNIKDGHENQQIKLKSFIEKFNTIVHDDNFNVIPKCNIISTIMKYGMLFFPLVNSFVSLLIFSVQCNLNVVYLKNLCFKFLQSEEISCEDNTTINNSETQFDSVTSKKVSLIKRHMKNILYVLKCNKMMKDKKITTIFVLSQWIIPILITGLLYLSEYNINPTKKMEDKKCFIESILFLDDCYNNIKTTNTSQNANIETYTIPVYNDYINDKEDITLQISNAQVNEIISKIQNLVFSAMNDTSAISFNTTSYNTSEFMDITNYLELGTYTNDMKQNKNIENEFNLINIENNTNLQSNIQLSNYTDEDNEGSLMTNFLKDTLKEKIYNAEINTNTTEKLNFRSPAGIIGSEDITNNFMNITKKYNIPFMLNGLKYNSKRTKELKKSKSTQIYTMDKCFISTQFLKVHLLMLVFIIYFLPILFSLILQQYGKLNCQIILEKLKAKKILLSNSKSDLTSEINKIYFDVPISSKGPSTLKQDSQCLNANLHPQKPMDFNELNLTETHEENFNKKWDEIHKDNKHSMSFNETKIQLNMNQLNQYAINRLQLFDNIKMSLLSGILLWTPLFFECLIKVFTVLYIPEWLLIMTYLAGTAFNTVRNVFNLKMIKLQEKNMSAIKTNSIHPIA